MKPWQGVEPSQACIGIDPSSSRLLKSVIGAGIERPSHRNGRGDDGEENRSE